MTTPLHVHSSYSIMGGLDSPRALCLAAKRMGYRKLALTDTNGVYGLLEFLAAAKEHEITPLVGVELVGSSEFGAGSAVPDPKHPQHRLVVLLTSEHGYGELCELLTALHQRHTTLTEQWRDPWPLWQSLAQGSVVFSDDRVVLQALRDVYAAERLYYEVSPGFTMGSDVNWAKAQGVACMVSTRVRHIAPQDAEVYRLLRAIGQNTTLSRVDLSDYRPTCTLWSEQALRERLWHLPEALRNTEIIAEMAAVSWSRGTLIFPPFDSQSEAESEALLRVKCAEGMLRRWGHRGEAFLRRARARLDHELKIITDKGFASYFLVVDDIVGQSGITCGRGSAAASAVSFCLGITHVDPIEHNLFFERFLNYARKDPPDIDVDFPWDERDQILDYVFAKYPERAAMVANHVTFGARSALREIAKVHGVPEAEIDYVSHRIPEFASSRALRRLDVRHDLPHVWQGILQQALRLDGQVRHLSVHCGGVVITPGKLSRYVPVQWATKGVPVIQWEKEQTEAAGLVKIDLLGNRSLAVVRDTLRAVSAQRDVIHLYQALQPLADPATQSLLKRGDSMGVFYIESPATRLLLQKMRTGEFEHIVIASSIIRPAANKFANAFVRRLHGEPYTPLHPLLEEILHESYGIMVYQEDVSKAAMALANFSPEDADGLRKVLSKKNKEKQLEDYRSRFFKQAERNGVSAEVLTQIWEMILSFSGYSFCKPHSASYALVSFKSCYLRAHHPAEFMAAVLSNQGGFYSTMTYLEEARRMGLQVLPPDVNASVFSYQGCGTELRAGLMQVKHLTHAGAQAILAARENGPFRNFEDFLQRVRPSLPDVKALIKARCVLSLAENRSLASLMWQAYAFQARAQGAVEGSVLPKVLPQVREYPSQQLLHWELEYLQGAVSFPAWTLYQAALAQARRVKGCDLARYVGRSVRLFGIKVTYKTTVTKNYEEMRFVTFSDDTALYETVFFPESFQRNRDLLFLDGAFFVSGRVENELGAIQVQVQTLEKVPLLV